MMRVAVAMSGGLDSSVAAALLKRDGYDVVGVTMTVCGSADVRRRRTAASCCAGDIEAEEARRTALGLGIPIHVFDLSREYETEVLGHARREYTSGRTPNPCVRCNRLIKLQGLLDKVRQAGIEFDRVATGHYARVEFDGQSCRHLLKTAADATKDQTYFLYSLSQDQLGNLVLPLGAYSKNQVRRMASALGVARAGRRESQDFIAGGYALIFDTAQQPGPILDEQGSVIGQHRGIAHYTVGQRKGIGLALKQAHYVTRIDPVRNALIVGTEGHLYSDELVCSELNWIAVESLSEPLEVTAKIRYGHPGAEAVVAPISGGRARVKFARPQMAITPGQAVVLYRGDVVIGGGTIDHSVR
jgi:tRNA-specific 2-thiouridylase